MGPSVIYSLISDGYRITNSPDSTCHGRRLIEIWLTYFESVMSIYSTQSTIKRNEA